MRYVSRKASVPLICTLVVSALAVAAPAHAVSYPIAPPVDIRTSACPANIVAGDSGTCVTALQDILIDWGFGQDLGPSGADGDFGSHTFAAVEAFQQAAAIGIDGQVGTQTKDAMYGTGQPWIYSSQLSVNEDTAQESSTECLDADTQTAGRNGQVVQGWSCNNQPQQAWTQYQVPNHPGEVMIVNVADGLCLDADTTTASHNGQKVQGWNCTGGTNQAWRMVYDRNGARNFVNVQDGQCLDADTNTMQRNGQRMQTWACNAQPQQEWIE